MHLSCSFAETNVAVHGAFVVWGLSQRHKCPFFFNAPLQLKTIMTFLSSNSSAAAVGAGQLRSSRQSMLFSATVPAEVLAVVGTCVPVPVYFSFNSVHATTQHIFTDISVYRHRLASELQAD
jgi:hypothetical protein